MFCSHGCFFFFPSLSPDLIISFLSLFLVPEFYTLLQETLVEYNILTSDTCAWQDDFTGQSPVVPTIFTPGFEGCKEHLEESFDCFWECGDE